MKMFDKIKGSIKTAQDKAKAMGKSETASIISAIAMAKDAIHPGKPRTIL